VEFTVDYNPKAALNQAIFSTGNAVILTALSVASTRKITLIFNALELRGLFSRLRAQCRPR